MPADDCEHAGSGTCECKDVTGYDCEYTDSDTCDGPHNIAACILNAPQMDSAKLDNEKIVIVF